jgi:hypothetical protein
MNIAKGTCWIHTGNQRRYVIDSVSRLESSINLKDHEGEILVTYYWQEDPESLHTRPISEWLSPVVLSTGAKPQMRFEPAPRPSIYRTESPEGSQ